MPRQSFKVVIGVRTPFLFAALQASAHGVDATAMRDAAGYPMLPGDHLRGHLRHAALALYGGDGTHPAPEVLALFGDKSQDRASSQSAGQDEPRRGALIISDLVATRAIHAGRDMAVPANDMIVYHRVKIDHDSGAADEGMLQMIEQPLGSGATVLFTGTITVRPEGPSGGRMPSDLKAALRDLLRLIPSMGSAKSAGFGEIDQTATKIEALPAPAPAPAAKASRLRVTVTFNQPILVDAERKAFNVMAGRTVIPGAAIKGALAAALQDNGLFAGSSTGKPDAFSNILVGHAFPLLDDKLADRTLPSAIALASDGGQQKACLAMDEADLLALAAHGTPIFPVDWKDKDFERAGKAFKRESSGLARQARGRVAIDGAGIAEEGQLFVTELVETSGRSWSFILDRNGADPGVFEAVLKALGQGVAGLGRTGATMTMSSLEDAPQLPAVVPGKVCLMLETAAVMTDPDSDVPVLLQYETYFKTLLGPDIADFRAVATRQYAGDYYAFRFRDPATRRYRPFELTEAGATFAFTAGPPEATALQERLRSGLPPLMAGRLLLNGEDNWRVCPFMHHNGYGEISLDDGWIATGLAGLEVAI